MDVAFTLDRTIAHYVRCNRPIRIQDRDGFDIDGPECGWEGFVDVEICDLAEEAGWYCDAYPDDHQNYMEWGKANGL